MNEDRSDYTTRLYRLASPLFLYLVSFRRKVRKDYSAGLTEVREDLDELFLQMKRDVKNDVRLETLYDKARYPLAVVADEVLLHSGWKHRDDWQREHLLEERMFNSNVGGDVVFERASRLKEHEVELAAIYFTSISLGTFSKRRD
ncbi:MAG: DotU family type IV/VI secretion system protein, partial [bacterium]|nr:DotU family type IV/VI secretion system protein [bacterium]